MRGTKREDKKILASQATKIYARSEEGGGTPRTTAEEYNEGYTAGSGLAQCDRSETVSRYLAIKCFIDSHQTGIPEGFQIEYQNK